MRKRWVDGNRAIAVLFIGTCWMLLSGATRPIDAQLCAGDCNGDGASSPAELQTAVGIALGELAAPSCSAVDGDGNGIVVMPELTRAIFARINGCAASPTSGAPRTSGVVVEIGSATGLPGQTVSFGVTLDAGGEEVAGVQNDIAFDPNTPIASTPSERPDCAVNPAINKPQTTFAFQPFGCTPGVNCTGIRAVVLSFSNVDPIPTGSQMYTCNVAIAPSAPFGAYPLLGFNGGAADPDGGAIPASVTDGSVTVGVAPTPTPVIGDAPASLILRSVKLRANVGIRLGRGLGSAKLDGVVDTNVPFGSLIDDLQASGLTIELTTDGTSIDLVWDAAACTIRTTPRGPRILCAADDADGRRTATLRPTGLPNVFRLKVFARHITLRPPLAPDPVQVMLSTATFRRPDEIGGCVVQGSESDRKICRESGILPSPTPSTTTTGTATRTGTPTRTATSTRTITNTHTPTRTKTPTSTATPVVVPSVPLGVRVFTLDPGIPFASPDFSRTGLFSSILSSDNFATSFSSGPLTLVGGLPDASGVAPLSLQEDVTLTVSLFDGSHICIKYVAAGSSGSIDCDGGTAYDVSATQPAGDVGPGFDLQTGLGAPAPGGNGNLLVMQLTQRVPAGPTPNCDAITYDDPAQLFAYTTTTATAIKGGIELAVAGEPFSCNEFATPGTGGMLAAPAPTTTDFGDAAEVFRLADVADERVFTVAPGTSLASPDDTGTGLFTSALSAANAALVFGPGPLRLVRGIPGVDGVASLHLASDVTIPVDVIDNTCLCLRLLADGSGGSIDCDGGTAYDTMATRPSVGGFAWTVDTGLGVPAGTGNANLLVDGIFERVFAPCTFVDCENHVFSDPPNVFAFTTTTATAVQEGPPDITLSVSGAPFDCDTFTVSGSGGMLAAPAPATIAPVGNVANVFRFAE